MVSKQPRKIILVFVLSLILAVPIYFFYLDSLAKPLKGIDIRELRVGGKTYSIKDGQTYREGKKLRNPATYRKVAGISYLYRATVEDPLFAGESFDDSSFEKSLSRMDSVQKEFIKMLEINEIVPLGFLNKVVEASRSNRNFLKNPGEKTGEDLIGKYKEAVGVYKQEVAGVKANIEKYFPIERDQPFMYVASGSSNKIMISDLALMLENAKILEQEIEKRERYLKGARWEANFLDQHIVLDELKENKSIKLLPVEDLTVETEFRESLKGPYMIETGCFGEEESLLYTYIGRNIAGENILIPKLAMENFYQKINNTNQAEKNLLERGYQWRTTREGNTYKCNDLEYQARILTLENFIEKYKADLLFQKVIDNKSLNGENNFLAKGREVETSFFEGNYKSDQNLKVLGKYYAELYKKLKGEEVSNGLENESLKRVMEIRNNQNNLDLVLNTTFFIDNLNQRISQGYVERSTSSFLVASRTAYSFSFFNFSPTVWRMEKKPKYLKKINIDDANRQYAPYSALIHIFPREEILSWHKITEKELIGLE